MLATRSMARSNIAYVLYPTLLCGAVFAVPGLFAVACVSTTQVTENTGGAGGGSGSAGLHTGGGGDDGTICVLRNCQDEADCSACSEGRKICSLRDHRCVTCDVVNGSGCTEGEVCSDFGSCVPMGLTCDVDDHGVPTVSCNTGLDCSACDPEHQVCDETAHKCVACSPLNMSNCQPGAQCTTNGACASACPTGCATSDDCAACAPPGEEAYTCASQKCVLKSGPTDGGTTGQSSSSGSSSTGGGGTCHDYCVVGGPLAGSCDPCAAAVCAKDSFCCDVKWDGLCVSQVGESCNKTCTALPASTCEHNECVAGVALTPDCSSCAEAVCGADDFCCKTTWDAICIGAVKDKCGITCK